MSCRRAGYRRATNLRLSAHRGGKHSASFREARLVPFDVVKVVEAMDSNHPVQRNEKLAAEFRRLWESSPTPPDILQFLANRPDAAPSERLDLLRIDQRFRWKRGEPRPLQSYLREFPEIAVRPDLVRLLVAGDQESRRDSGAQPFHLLEGIEEIHPSQARTQVIGGRNNVETIAEDQILPPPPSSTASFQQPTAGPGSTHDASPATQSGDLLGFNLGTPLEISSEAETLQPMLENVRFTLLRRLGAGGMGVVFETYDEERGELVALKTMRRLDPSSLVRFKQEFRALCDITHPNLVNLYQLFAVEDCWFFTMELVDGCDFLTYVGRGPRREAYEPCAVGGAAWSAPGSVAHESRLRDGLIQLAAGVQALHAAGKLHRDIKPTNVLVARDGRVVLLDFGLMADLEPTGQHHTVARQVVGTLAHMSPEQALGLAVSAASDWYSVGVILYQALTGRIPFDGSFDEVVLLKQTAVPPAPDTLVPGLPEDLVRLCQELLARDPAGRPRGPGILKRLRGHSESTVEVSQGRQSISLIGRSWHRHVLDSGYASLVNRQTSTVFVFGRTGTGKTTLIRSFLDDLRSREDTLVLAGRCYEQEWVPFKAIDSLIDALARHLKQLSSSELARLLPHDVSLLARVFPVIRSVDGVLAERGPVAELPDPQELRMRVFAGLRELLVRLGRETNLVLMIDDLQWGDVDSAVLLADLIFTPDPPILLFLGSYRLEDADQNRFLQTLRQARDKGPGSLHHRDLAVEALTQAESRELALALLGRDDTGSRAQAHIIARESAGNPLFIDELVKHLQAGVLSADWDAAASIELETVLWVRIQALPIDAQRLLEVVAVAGRPIHESLAFRAAELGAGGRVALATLRSARLIRGISPAQLDQIEIYHDRVRETVLTHLSRAARRWCHERLARALEVSGQADPEVLAGHFLGAGDRLRAGDFYDQAADKAASALAFDRAARLYRLAIELDCHPPATQRRLGKKLGDALSNGGRGAEAAGVYLQAALGATAAEALELKRQASTQLLISGHVDEGLALLRTILVPLGLSMPSTPQAALLSLVHHRAMLRLRGLRFQSRDETQVSAEDLTRIDLCWSAVAGLSLIDPVLGADFQTRGLLLALRAGEPFRVSRALAMEAAHQSTAGNRSARRVESLIRRAENLALRLDSPHARGMIHMVRGVSGLMLGQWKQAQSSFDNAESLLRNHCTGVTWERDTVNSLALWALMHMGQIAELKRRWSLLIREAHDCGDLYAATTLTTSYMTMIRLADDDSSGIEDELEEVMNQWTRRGFFIQHSTALRSLVHLDLYRGRVDAAWARLSAIWPEYSRSMLMRIQMIRIQMLELRARSALAVAEHGKDTDFMLQSAEQDARRLKREGQPWSVAHAHYVRAAIAACREDASTAIHQLALAADLFDAADMPLCGCVMRYKIGEIRGGDEGRALITRAEEWMVSQSIKSPARWSCMVAPGFSGVITCQIETSY